MTKQKDEQEYRVERQRMVVDQIQSRDIYDRRVLEAMRIVPRHCFVPEESRNLAYIDGPLPIGCGQTISQPYIVALMTQLLLLKESDTVLEIGTGSGYQAAVLASLVKQVYTVERVPGLAEKAGSILKELGILNVEIRVGDGSLGWLEYSPYQAIIVTAAAPAVPKSLLNQLEEGGRLVIPVGEQWGQYLERWHRKGNDFKHEVLVPVAFVPLKGAEGWKEEIWGLD